VSGNFILGVGIGAPAGSVVLWVRLDALARALRHISWFAWFLIFLGLLALVVIPLAAPALGQQQTSPNWCTYPDPGGVSALHAAIDQHAAEIARNSPGQPIDRFTLQLDLMTSCAR
jgi:hypothetical protein